MNKTLFLLVVILYSSVFFSQENEMYSGLRTSKNDVANGLNLKDSVKSARFFYSYVKEGLSSNERSRVITKNFMRTYFYVEFDQYGMFKKKLLSSGKKNDYADAPIDSSRADVYEFDEADRILKSKFKLKIEQISGVYIEDKICINYINNRGISKFTHEYIYTYTYDEKGKIIKELLYRGYYKQNTVLHYNEHGDMIEINHINNPRESWDKQPEYTTTWDGGPLTMKYDYDYDSHNNWIKCRMYLEENKDEPTIIAERVIEYFDKKN